MAFFSMMFLPTACFHFSQTPYRDFSSSQAAIGVIFHQAPDDARDCKFVILLDQG